MTFHYVEFQTYCHATEDLCRVKEALETAALIQMDLEETDLEGYHGNRIMVLRGKLTARKDIHRFFENLPKEMIAELLYTLEQRVDEDCNLYFRIHKGQAYLGDLVLSSGDYIIRVRAKVESYPSKPSKAMANLSTYLSGLEG